MRIQRLFSQIDIDPSELDIPQPGAPNDTTISSVLELVFSLAGVVAMLVIVIAGIQFMLSRGDPQKSAIARNAIIYAAIGLILATLAFSIVRFVVGEI